MKKTTMVIMLLTCLLGTTNAFAKTVMTEVAVDWTYRSLEELDNGVLRYNTSQITPPISVIEQVLLFDDNGVPQNPVIWDYDNGDAAHWDQNTGCHNENRDLRLIRGEFELNAEPANPISLELNTVDYKENNFDGLLSVNDWVWVYINGEPVLNNGTDGPGAYRCNSPGVEWCNPSDLSIPTDVLNWGTADAPAVNEIELVLMESCDWGGLRRIEFFSILEEVPDACVFGSERIQISNAAVVNAAVQSNGTIDIQAGNNNQGITDVKGNAVAGDMILVGASAAIEGDAVSGGPIYAQNGSTITGTAQEYAPVTDIILPEYDVTPDYSNNVYINRDNGCDETLEPGTYGTVIVAPTCRLTLQPGTYEFAMMIVNADGKLALTGAADIYTKDRFELGDRATFDAGETAAEDILVYSNGSVRIGTDTAFTGYISAPNGSADLSNNSVLSGCIKGRYTTIHTGATVN